MITWRNCSLPCPNAKIIALQKDLLLNVIFFPRMVTVMHSSKFAVGKLNFSRKLDMLKVIGAWVTVDFIMKVDPERRLARWATTTGSLSPFFLVSLDSLSPFFLVSLASLSPFFKLPLASFLVPFTLTKDSGKSATLKYWELSI